MRSSRSGNSRNGAGAPIASGLKKLRGSFMRTIPQFLTGKARMNGGIAAKPLLAPACLGNGVHTISPRISRGCEAAGVTPSRISARRSGPMRSTR